MGRSMYGFVLGLAMLVASLGASAAPLGWNGDFRTENGSAVNWWLAVGSDETGAMASGRVDTMRPADAPAPQAVTWGQVPGSASGMQVQSARLLEPRAKGGLEPLDLVGAEFGQVNDNQAGTTLSATITAQGFRERRHDWSFDKSVSPSSVEVAPGASQVVTFTLTATRDAGTLVTGVRGEVCVTNGGERDTEGLLVQPQVQSKTGNQAFTDLAGASTVAADQANDADDIILAGETKCFPYEITFTPTDGAKYRVRAGVTITNHSGWLGVPFGPNPKADFTVPTAETPIDATATVVDVPDCPTEDGFSCAYSGFDGALTGSAVITFTLTITNDSAPCGISGLHTNTASLTEDTTGAVREDSEQVTVSTPACDDGGDGGCTRTIGFWKNHGPNAKGKQLDAISPLLPIYLGTQGGAKTLAVTTGTQAENILKQDGASNGIVKLYAQMLAAKLNVASGAGSAAIAADLAAADAFLASNDQGAWSGLSADDQAQVLAWKDAFDAFNNGDIGPGHC